MLVPAGNDEVFHERLFHLGVAPTTAPLSFRDEIKLPGFGYVSGAVMYV